MDSTEVLRKLLKVAKDQQKMIKKLAQQLNPGQMDVSVDDTGRTAVNSAAPANQIAPGVAIKNEERAILDAMDAVSKSSVLELKVSPSTTSEYSGVVLVKFKPGQSTDAAFAGVQSAVVKANLPGKSYLVQEVA